MNTQPLTRLDGPRQHACVTPAAALAAALDGLAKTHTTIRLVRGNKSRRLADFYNEISAALQFPLYFGENWDALSDCLADLSWLHPPAGLLLVFADAPSLLDQATPDDAHTFRRVIGSAISHWQSKRHQPFHVLFHAETPGELNHRWPGLPMLE